MSCMCDNVSMFLSAGVYLSLSLYLLSCLSPIKRRKRISPSLLLCSENDKDRICEGRKENMKACVSSEKAMWLWRRLGAAIQKKRRSPVSMLPCIIWQLAITAHYYTSAFCPITSLFFPYLYFFIYSGGPACR